ncbi:hypothetical protein BDZ85DRAFT_268821 [Elsinoe ampelina]|uniref:Uncharacterized protein n=1 Tax=Elsinoe ampelina TaxID=302913 RepID=A0A6A6G0X6_9PEZI|nr:hypothetical protein BDZ85DRAFT_268821 [Elsinoe ampelina]
MRVLRGLLGLDWVVVEWGRLAHAGEGLNVGAELDVVGDDDLLTARGRPAVLADLLATGSAVE